jgi:hypothetical protein
MKMWEKIRSEWKYAKPKAGLTSIKKKNNPNLKYKSETSVRCVNAQEVTKVILGVVTGGRSNRQ